MSDHISPLDNLLAPPQVSRKEVQGALWQIGLGSDELVKKALTYVQHTQGHVRRLDGSPQLEGHIYPVVTDLIECGVSTHDPRLLQPDVTAANILHDVFKNDYALTPRRVFEDFGAEVVKLLVYARKPTHKSYPGNTENEQKYARDLDFFASLLDAPEVVAITRLGNRNHNLRTVHALSESAIWRTIDVTKSLYVPLAAMISNYYYDKLTERIAQLEAAGFQDRRDVA